MRYNKLTNHECLIPLQEAVEACYRLVSAVHSIWKPIKREFDDYIANPKPSGYQALHTGGRGVRVCCV